MTQQKVSQELINKHFGIEGGGAMVKTSLVRLYTLLDGFDATHVGLYAYFRSWRNSSDEDRLNTVWHGKEYMQLQTGLGRTAFDSRLKKLVEVGLISEIPSSEVPNKKIYYVHDPLSRDEFIDKYPEAVAEFTKKVAELEEKNRKNREDRRRRDLEAIRKIREETAENTPTA